MRTKCILCGEELHKEPLYICENMPAKSQDLQNSGNLSEDKAVDLRICQCKGCGLIQFDGDPVPYYLDSTRAGERSEVLIKMRQDQYKHLVETYNLRGKKIVEIGAGKGGFLKTLQEMPSLDLKGYGIEHNKEFAKIACDNEKVNVVQCNPESSEWQHEEAPFDAFMSFAYPARMIDPNSMMKGIYKNTVDDAVGIIQVPSLEHLLRPGGFFDVAVDHVAYYNRDTLRFLAEKNGFEVLEEGEIGGVYLYVIVKKRSIIDLRKIWADVEPLAAKVRDFVNSERNEGRKIAVWCAGHFAFTVLSVTGIGNQISYIIDNAKFKQGCYAPASHVPIVSPEYFDTEPVDTVMVLAPFYAKEIIEEIRTKLPEQTKIAVMNNTELNIL